MANIDNLASADNVELETKENLYWVQMAEALTRLERNEDFKKVIMEGYFKDRAINGVSMLAQPGVKDSGRRPDVMEDLIAISSLQDYLLLVHDMGSVPIDEDEE